MTRATLAEVLAPALRDRYAVAGLVCLGWEDARAYVQAAEAVDAPVILQAGPGARAHMPIPVWGKMLGDLAENASVPVVIHLDHGHDIEDCRAAIGEGFTSVMYDGSALPLDENIAATRAVVELAHENGVSCEGEIGFVGYQDGADSRGTDPGEAGRFVRETGVDAVAISVGNVHLQQDAQGQIDESRLSAIEAATHMPLVIHGGSGIPAEDRKRLATSTAICKFNIGTELRMAFGAALRDVVAGSPEEFDRIKLLDAAMPSVCGATKRVILGLRHYSV